MKNNRKKELMMLFYIAEFKNLETHFTLMANKGWMIDKIGMFFCEYKKIIPQEYHFHVDFFEQITTFDYPENDEVQEYRQLCEYTGWKLATSNRQIQVFFTEIDNNIPIHTDKQHQAKQVLKIARKQELLSTIIIFISFCYMWSTVFIQNYNLLLSNLLIAYFIATLILTLPLLWNLGFIVIWYFKMILAIKKGLGIIDINYKLTRIRNKISISLTIISLAILLIGIILDINTGGSKVNLIRFILPFAGIFASKFVRKKMDNKKRSKEANKIIVSFILMVTFLLITITPLIVSDVFDIGVAKLSNLPKNMTALKLSDLGIETPLDAYYYNYQKSIVVPVNYSYYESSGNNNIYTKVQKVINEYLTCKIFQKRYIDLKGYGWKLKEMSSEQIEDWKAIQGYYIIRNDNVNVLLLYKDSIIEVQYKVENSLEHIIQEKIKLIGLQ